MKKISLLIVCMLWCFALSAWGPTGHRTTGLIAEKYLSKKAKKNIDRILNGQSLSIASTWMDEIRSDSTFDHTHDWHWVTIPDGMTYEGTEKNQKGDIIETITRVINALKSKSLPPDKEAQQLKILIHLIGDIHQPLHVGRGNDRGGNDIKVSWFGTNSNLHRVWDSDMIDDTKLSYTELAASLEQPDKEKIRSWQNTSVTDWANESIAYRSAIYEHDGKLGYKYSYAHFHIVRLRLLQAGVRLAGVLNEIYG